MAKKPIPRELDEFHFMVHCALRKSCEGEDSILLWHLYHVLSEYETYKYGVKDRPLYHMINYASKVWKEEGVKPSEAILRWANDESLDMFYEKPTNSARYTLEAAIKMVSDETWDGVDHYVAFTLNEPYES